jgi:hypothetical protein
MDHFLMDTSCVFDDTVAVLFEGGLHWTSDALTSDSTSLWGQFPVSVSGPGGLRNESDIIEFGKEGSVLGRFRVGHRVTGLSWDGENLWSLSTSSDAFRRLDPQGNMIDSVSVGIPDLVDIEFDGEDFWAIGWFMKRLYRIDGSGEVTAVFHLPGEHEPIFPAGLTLVGARFWYGFNTSYLDSRVYRLLAE